MVDLKDSEEADFNYPQAKAAKGKPLGEAVDGESPAQTVPQLHRARCPRKVLVEDPTLGVHLPEKGQLSDLGQKIKQMESHWGDTPLFMRLRKCLPWWLKNATHSVLEIIQKGVQPPWEFPPPLKGRPQFHSQEEISNAKSILEDYLKTGAVRLVKEEHPSYYIPWFVLEKMEENGLKKRLIADCRELNQFHSTEKFRLDNIQKIFPYLRQGQFAGKIDLKDAYFHIGISDSYKPFLRKKVGSQIWEFQAACFGLSPLPKIFMDIMKTFEKKWRKKGIQVFIYLDDILVLGATAPMVQKHMKVVVTDLLESGFTINTKKSILEPSQSVPLLGFHLNLKEGLLQISPSKLKVVRKELGKLLTKDTISCRKMAAILGKVRANLVALPFLRAFTDTMVEFTNLHTRLGWDHQAPVPKDLKLQLKEVENLLKSWPGRPFVSKPQRHFHSDSSTFAWAGLDPSTGTFVQEFWREKASLHINIKELEAAIFTIKSLGKPGQTILLSVDNQVAFYYLTKGGGDIPISMPSYGPSSLGV